MCLRVSLSSVNATRTRPPSSKQQPTLISSAQTEVAPGPGELSTISHHSRTHVPLSGILLSCGSHGCPSRCHQIVDHSKKRCENVMRTSCANGHPQTWKCHQGRHAACNQCERDKKAAEEQRLREYELQQQREAAQLRHNHEIDALNVRIAEQERLAQEARLAGERAAVIRQKEEDIRNLKDRVAQITAGNLGASQTSKQAVKSSANDARSKAPASPLQTHSAASPSKPPPRTGTAASSASGKPSQPPSLFTDPQKLPGRPDSPQDKNIATQTPPITTPHGASNSTRNPSVHPSQQSRGPKSRKPKLIPFLPPSASEIEWQRQKSMEGASNAALDELMSMIGLEDVKETMLTIKAAIDLKKRQGVSLMNERLNSVFLGNPGTGSISLSLIILQLEAHSIL